MAAANAQPVRSTIEAPLQAGGSNHEMAQKTRRADFSWTQQATPGRATGRANLDRHDGHFQLTLLLLVSPLQRAAPGRVGAKAVLPPLDPRRDK